MAEGWKSEAYAEAWNQGAEQRARLLGEVTERMLDRAGLAPGMRVLDLGTGTGDTALVAAARVGSSGQVLATDSSEAMVKAAEAVFQAKGVKQVTAQTMDASRIEVPPASFDAVIARLVLMFVDLPRALAGIHAALRPGGRLAAVVWGPLEDNPYHRALIEAGQSRGAWPEGREPEIVHAFSLSDAARCRGAFESAGFAAVAVERVGIERRFASAEEALETVRGSPVQAAVVAHLGARDHEEALQAMRAAFAPYDGSDGCVFPGCLLVVSGARP